jgi:uncharacterized protein YjbI with pentapeptide repeats
MADDDSTYDKAESRPPRQLKRAEDNVYYKLALKGKEVWNRWMLEALTAEQIQELGLHNLARLNSAEKEALSRELGIAELPDSAIVSFISTEFPETVDFSDFVFIDSYFGGATFRGDAWFHRATFTRTAGFQEVTFMENAEFRYATFTGNAWFHDSTFKRNTDFTQANFTRVLAQFDRATFRGFVVFTGSIFTRGVRFGGATFTGDAAFDDVTFTSLAWFHGARFTSLAWFDRSTFTGDAIFTGSTPFEQGVDFSGISTFGGRINFSNRKFKGTTTFRGRAFTQAPIFHNATLHQDTDFGETSFHPIFDQPPPFVEDLGPYWSRTARAFRTLALAMNKAHAHEDEVRFFAFEMRAKERYETGARKWLIVLYRWFGDYGQSITRPSLWLARAYGLAAALNLALAKTLPACVAPTVLAECERWVHLGKVLAFTATSTVPFLGQARIAGDMAATLFDPARLPVVYGISVVQGLASIVFIFLIGLALRNRFRIK